MFSVLQLFTQYHFCYWQGDGIFYSQSFSLKCYLLTTLNWCGRSIVVPGWLLIRGLTRIVGGGCSLGEISLILRWSGTWKLRWIFLLNCLGACLEGLVGYQACCCISSPWLRWGICYPWCAFLDLYLFLKICVEFCGGGYMFRWDFSIQWFGQDFIGVLIVNNHDILVTLNYGYQEMPHMITEELSCKLD